MGYLCVVWEDERPVVEFVVIVAILSVDHGAYYTLHIGEREEDGYERSAEMPFIVENTTRHCCSC